MRASFNWISRNSMGCAGSAWCFRRLGCFGLRLCRGYLFLKLGHLGFELSDAAIRGLDGAVRFAAFRS